MKFFAYLGIATAISTFLGIPLYFGLFYGLALVALFGWLDIPEKSEAQKQKEELIGLDWMEKSMPGDPWPQQRRDEINKKYMPKN